MTQTQTMRGRLLVRKARMSDAARIAALSMQLGYPSSFQRVGSRLRPMLGHPGHAILVAGTREGEVVGWIHIFVRWLVESDPHAEIGGLVVDEGFRGRGVGGLLLRHAEQWARKKRLGCIRLRTNITRKDTHTFYERLGYERIKTQYTYLKRLTPRVS